MSCQTVSQEIADVFQNRDYFRIVVFGASNTERYMPSVHWSDVLEVGLRTKFGRKFHMINSGYSGNNTLDALKRFDRDVASFAPDIVIVTLGGNDCNPQPKKFVSGTDFSKNLDVMIQKIRDLGAVPVLQTYYKMVLEDMDPVRAENFVCYMQLVREAAQRNNVFLVDQYKYFEAADSDEHRYKLMINSRHTNEMGNCLMGVILLQYLGIDPETIPHNETLLGAMALYRKITAQK